MIRSSRILSLHSRVSGAGGLIFANSGKVPHFLVGENSRSKSDAKATHPSLKQTRKADVATHFATVKDSDIMREVVRRFAGDVLREPDIVIVGSGVAGLSCAWEIIKTDPDIKLTIIERQQAPGGTHWNGCTGVYPAMVVRKPADAFVKELGVEYDEKPSYIVVKHIAMFTSALLSKVLSSPNVKLCSGMVATDLLVTAGNVTGVSTQFTHATTNSLDHTGISSPPSLVHCGVVVSACGSSKSSIAVGSQRIKLYGYQDVAFGTMGPSDLQCGTININESEDALVHHTRSISPGLIVCGSEVAWLDSCGSTGPTNGAMIQSGIKAGRLAVKELRENEYYMKEQRVGLEAAGHFIGNF